MIKMAMVRMENWSLKVFFLSTLFITIFSVQAIYNWPPLAEKLSILIACSLPLGFIILNRAGVWVQTRQFPKELTWVFLIFTFGLLSCLFSENRLESLKSMGLFLASGPFVFFTAKILFESKKNQESYLWMTSLCFLAFAIWGIYEHFSLGIVYLFSRNPLPSGAILILLSAGPMILLSKTNSIKIKFILALSLFFSIALIFFMAKKSHLLGLFVLLVSLSIFYFRKYFKFFLGSFLLIGLLLFNSDPIRTRYQNMLSGYNSLSTLSTSNSKTKKQNLPLSIYGSIPLRAENYFFGFHVIPKIPIWGLGFGGNLEAYFRDYNLRFEKYFSKKQYQEYIKSLNTFENIVITYTIEWGCLFALIYFGGVLHIIGNYLKTVKKSRTREVDGIFLAAIITSFAVMSLTFDTLRFPNLNWVFHSLLGLLANFSSQSSFNNEKHIDSESIS